MADNTVLNAGAGGDTIATDDVGGVKHQLVKVEYGALDSATAVAPAIVIAVKKKYAGSFNAEIDQTNNVGMNSSTAKPPSAASGPNARRAVRWSAIAPPNHITTLRRCAP